MSETRRMSSIARRFSRAWLGELFWTYFWLDFVLIILSLACLVYTQEKAVFAQDWGPGIERRLEMDGTLRGWDWLMSAVLSFRGPDGVWHDIALKDFVDGVRPFALALLWFEGISWFFSIFAMRKRVRKLLRAPGTPVQDIPDRGLDHGAYVPLVEMFPEADIPVLQISMPTLDPQRLLEIGRRLAPLRDEGVLIIGSGFFTHNLRALSSDGRISSVMAEFDDWGRRALDAHDLDALLDFEHKAPAGRLAHPRTEHFAPLFVTLGAGEADLGSQRSVIDGFWMGLAKRSIQLG